MIYALTITILAGVALLALFVGVALLARKVAQGEGLSALRGWRWYPSPLALLVLIPIAAFVLFRAVPFLLVIPLIIPFYWRSRRMRGRVSSMWNMGRKRPREDDDDHTIDAKYHPFSDN